MGYSSDKPNVLQQVIAYAAAAVVLLTGASTVFKVTKYTPSPTTVYNIAQFSGTGSNPPGVLINSRGQVIASGALVSKSILSCNTIDTTSTGMLICGTDATGAGGGGTSTGALQTAFDARYLRKAGGTVTGSVVVNRGANLTISGAILNGTGSFRRYATFVLTGSGVTTATGVNVFGSFEMGFAGRVKSAYGTVSQVASNNLTTITPKFNGTNIFSTNITIDSAEKSVRTAATAPVVDTNANTFTGGTILTFNVNAPATTPAKDLKITLILDATSFPQ